MYPPDAMCYLIPPIHIDAYKKWTIARSKKQRFKQIEVVYPAKLYSLNRAQRVEREGNNSKEKIRIFDHLKNTYEHLNASMASSRWRSENQKSLLGLPPKGFKNPVLRLPTDRAHYSIEMRPRYLPRHGPRASGKGRRRAGRDEQRGCRDF